jgi:hypothetical protein
MNPFAWVLPVVRFYQSPAGAGQRGSNRSHRKTCLGRDLRIAEPRIPQEQDFPVSGCQRVQRLVY